MARLMREVDWGSTPLGPTGAWPQSLRSAVSILLSSRAEIVLFWGPDLVALYNDAYAPTFGTKHPWALGKPARECWSEVWDVLGPLFENVLATGKAFWAKDHLFLLHRHGYLEETYYDVSYDPVRAEGGAIGGIFCIVSEKTRQVIGERRLRLLRQIAVDTSSLQSADEVCVAASSVLAAHAEDIPFSLLYSLQEETARLVASSGIEPGTSASPRTVSIADTSFWPVSDSINMGEPSVVSGLRTRFDCLPNGLWDEAPDTAVILPLTSAGQDDAVTAVLIAGVSPRRALDADYEDFLALVAGQIATSLASAQAYEAERRRAESLAELDRAKTLFFSNVSHEFRTPLTLMMAPLEDMLSSRGLGDTLGAEANLQTAYRNSLRLLRLVNTLLDFSRIESGRIEAVYEPTDIAELTRDLASAFRSAIERAGLRFTVDCPRPSQDVYLDRDMWEKIVLNLLSNALKFTFQGEIGVSLMEGDGFVELAVSDTGTGIPEGELSHIFERFHRVRDAESRTHEGSGIGLALVQELARLHGGDASVESVYGAGSTFRVRIPTGSAHLPTERIGSARTLDSTAIGAGPFVEEALRWLGADTAPARVAGVASQRGVLTKAKAHTKGAPTVLVADDNADMRDYISRLLQERWNVVAVADGETAFKEAVKRTVHLVVSDVMMPGLDGFALVNALRSRPETAALPVILLSARAGEEARIEGFSAGADDYLVKPFSARELMARVQTQLALSAARREREESIRESEQRYVDLIEAMGLAVYTTDAEGVLTYYNEEAAVLWGRHPVIGAERWCGSWRMLRPDGTPLPHDLCPMAVALKEDRPVRGVEAIAERPDGSRVWFAPYPTPLHDRAGNLTGAVNILVDITNRKQAEEAASYLQAIIQSSDDAIVSKDLNGIITSWNPGAERLFGYTAEETIGRSIRLIIPPDHQAEEDEVLARVRGGDRVDHFETIRLRKDGSEVPISLTISPVKDSNGKIIGASKIARDLGQRRDFYNMLMQSPLPIAVFKGEDLVCELANQHVIDALCRDITGQPLAVAAPEVREQGIDKRLLAVLNNGEPVMMMEQLIRLPGESGLRETYWNYSFTPLRDQAGRVDRVMMVGAEVTKEVLARKEMEEVIALKDQFLGLVSHELRTPIATVVANALILLRRGELLSQEDKTQALEDIVTEGDRLQKVIENLLMLTRIEGSDGATFRSVDLVDIVNKQIESFLHQNPARKVTLSHPVGLPAVEGQEDLLAIVIANLIGNANKYSPAGRTIEVTLATNASDEVEVHVRDQGIGVEEADLANLFVPFYRTGNARRYAAGMGLGLAVCKRIIEAHGGRIWASRRPEGGSDFAFALPH
jgi:PAS domain S-box-containing protein